MILAFKKNKRGALRLSWNSLIFYVFFFTNTETELYDSNLSNYILN